MVLFGLPADGVAEPALPVDDAIPPCMDFVFPLPRPPIDSGTLAASLGRFLQHALGRSAVYLGVGTVSVVVSAADLYALDAHAFACGLEGVDIVELRVDALAQADHRFIAEQLAWLRLHAAGLPIIYALRSIAHAGDFEGDVEEAMRLMRLGIALGVDVLDVECDMPQECIAELDGLRRSTLLLGSCHRVRESLSEEELRSKCQACLLGGRAAAATVVVKGTKLKECRVGSIEHPLPAQNMRRPPHRVPSPPHMRRRSSLGKLCLQGLASAGRPPRSSGQGRGRGS